MAEADQERIAMAGRADRGASPRGGHRAATQQWWWKRGMDVPNLGGHNQGLPLNIVPNQEGGRRHQDAGFRTLTLRYKTLLKFEYINTQTCHKVQYCHTVPVSDSSQPRSESTILCSSRKKTDPLVQNTPHNLNLSVNLPSRTHGVTVPSGRVWLHSPLTLPEIYVPRMPILAKFRLGFQQIVCPGHRGTVR